MVLYNDVKHYEDQKRQKEAKEAERLRLRRVLQEQIHQRESERQKSKLEQQQFYRQEEEKYSQWKQSQTAHEEEKVRKLLDERDKNMAELEMIRTQKKREEDRKRAFEARELDEAKRTIDVSAGWAAC